jgi:DNA-binding MarR family transcriptional regulator
MDAFRAVRRIMPMQHAYAFLLVALEEGRGVQEYADRAGVTQAVMTRILFALGSRSQGWESGYGLVQQDRDTEDARRHQTFLTAKGKALMHEVVRVTRSDSPRAMKLRRLPAEASQGSFERDQWLSKLIALGSKLGTDDVRLVVRQVEALIGHRNSKNRDAAKRAARRRAGSR